MISREKSQSYVVFLQPRALLRHTNVFKNESKSSACRMKSIHRQGKVLETWLSKKLDLMHQRTVAWNWACLENPVWENGTPRSVLAS